AISDVSLPAVELLRSDFGPYSPSEQKYLRLPDSFDPRISALAAKITSESTNRYDAAKAIETYLKSNYGYTLQLKAGGPDPLADFLFNVRE
ncbi:transglutaminase-like domain-containing protein, partial [Escherichia coli]|nr:transglutaminase-like domain-containing protein [Escherichia coli]